MRKLSSVVKDEKVTAVFETMGPTLHAAIAARQPGLTDEEEAELVQPVNLFNAPSKWHRYHDDIKIYMEACLAHANSGLPAQMLITNDHKFFTMFLRSQLAEDVLHSVVTDVLAIREGVRVKLAGELIAGL